MPGYRYEFGPADAPPLYSLSEEGVLTTLRNKAARTLKEEYRATLEYILENAERKLSFGELIKVSRREKSATGNLPETKLRADLRNVICALEQKLVGCEIASVFGFGYQVDWQVARKQIAAKPAAEAKPDALWTHLQDECERRRTAFVETLRIASGESFYVPRGREDLLRGFLGSPHAAAVIVGNSGVGKTTMVAHLATDWSGSGHLCAVFPVAELYGGRDGLQSLLAARLGTERFRSNFWSKVNESCAKRGSKLVLFIDAVNQFNDRMTQDSSASQLMLEINGFVSRLAAEWREIKLVITCRPETWRDGTRNSTEFGRIKDTYFEGIDGIRLESFSESEAKAAFEKYRPQRNIQTEYGHLTAFARYLLREPFFLDLATEVYAGRGIPRNLDTAEVFAQYVRDLNERGLGDLIHDVVEDFFTNDDGKRVPGVLQRASIDRDVRKRDQNLFERLFRGAEGRRLREERVLSQVSSIESAEIRFTYDRVAEYLIASQLLLHIDKLIEAGQWEIDAITSVITANLENAQKMNVALGALQQTLSDWLQRCSADAYADVLKRLAAYDARGLNLVISALARAGRSADGLKIMTVVLKSLEPRKNSAQFPVMYAVYRIICDGAYQAWLAEQGALRAAHHELLYRYFDWGFSHPSEDVSNVAVLYLFFLWRSDSPEVAVDATRMIVSNIDGLKRMLRPAYRAKLRNITGLLIMVLAEKRGRDFDEAWNIVKTMLLRLAIRENFFVKAAELLGSSYFKKLVDLMAGYLIDVLLSLGNPINARELDGYYKHRDENYPYYRQVVQFLIGDCDPQRLKEFAMPVVQNEQSFTFQMLTFALSVSWELSKTPGQSQQCLDMIEKLAESGEPIAEYCASLALYHLNCFSTTHNGATMGMMEKLARGILTNRKGEFQLRQQTYNFNIIGTYGKALNMNPTDGGAQRSYANVALESARISKDPAFYVYVCENLGLLGVLVQLPRSVLEVFSEVLTDVGLIGGATKEKALFRDYSHLKEARRNICQSLANIRAVYREDVDQFLVDLMEKPGGADLYSKVAGDLTPRFNLATFQSWAFEQLMFRVFTEYREQIGIDILKAFDLGAQQRSTKECIWAMVNQFLGALEKVQV